MTQWVYVIVPGCDVYFPPKTGKRMISVGLCGSIYYHHFFCRIFQSNHKTKQYPLPLRLATSSARDVEAFQNDRAKTKAPRTRRKRGRRRYLLRRRRRESLNGWCAPRFFPFVAGQRNNAAVRGDPRHPPPWCGRVEKPPRPPFPPRDGVKHPARTCSPNPARGDSSRRSGRGLRRGCGGRAGGVQEKYE